MASRRLGLALICAAWLAASGALAQVHDAPMVQLREVPPPSEAPPPEAAPAADAPTAVAPLVVTGALSPRELRNVTAKYVLSVAKPTDKLDQLARWYDPVCVLVSGLTEARAAPIKARVEDVAKAMGLSVRKDGCDVNLRITFDDQPQALLDRIAASREEVLGYNHRHFLNTVKAVTRPIQSWYMTASVNDPGDFAAFVAAGHANPPKEEVIDDPNNSPPVGCAQTFTICLQSVFKHVLVVVDKNKVKDKDSKALADYAVMLALSQPRSLDGCNILPSVIDLFASCPGRDAVYGLTRADVAYLTALYRADLQAKKAGEQSDIAARMVKALGRNKATDRLVAQPPEEAEGGMTLRRESPALLKANWTFMRGGFQDGWSEAR